MGRKAIPTALKLVKGTQRSDRQVENEPTPQKGNTRPPTYLSTEAKKVWRKAVKVLEANNVFTEMDEHALSLFCEAFARWLKAQKELRDNGEVIKAPSGYPVTSPWLSVSNKAFEQMTKIMTEFGMTPASRTKVNVTPPAPGSGGTLEDEILERFLGRHK